MRMELFHVVRIGLGSAQTTVVKKQRFFCLEDMKQGIEQ